ncbi:plasmid recombination protein, partial [Acinetobacter baumannii]
MYLHMDEKTPHIEAYVMPFDKRNRLNCRSFLGGAKKLTELQTEYANAMAPMGLTRGMKGSPATHTTVKQFYALIEGRNRISNAS